MSDEQVNNNDDGQAFPEINQDNQVDNFFDGVDLPFEIVDDDGTVLNTPQTSNDEAQGENIDITTKRSDTNVSDDLTNENYNPADSLFESFAPQTLTPEQENEKLRAELESVRSGKTNVPENTGEVSPAPVEDPVTAQLVKLTKDIEAGIANGYTAEEIQAYIIQESEKHKTKTENDKKYQQIQDRLDRSEKRENYGIQTQNNLYNTLQNNTAYKTADGLITAIADQKNGAGKYLMAFHKTFRPDESKLTGAAYTNAISNWFNDVKATQPEMLDGLAKLARAQLFENNYEALIAKAEKRGVDKYLANRQVPGSNGNYAQ